VGNPDGRVSGFANHFQHIGKGRLRQKIGIALYKTGLELFHLSYHLNLIFNGLRAKDKGKPAVSGKGNGKVVVRNRLHNSRNKGDIQMERSLFALFELNKRGL